MTALEDLVENVGDTHYLVGSLVGPDPFPRMVRDFQSVIGEEARQQMLERTGEVPDACVACVGGGSNAIGLFDAFRDDVSERSSDGRSEANASDYDVAFYGGEGGGKGAESDEYAAPLAAGEDDILHGMRTRVIEDDTDVHSVSAGLDYPGVGPEHAMFRDEGRAEYHAVTDDEALEAFRDLSRFEGITPALETAHGLALAKKVADDHKTLLVNLSGRGDKDMETAARSSTCRRLQQNRLRESEEDEKAQNVGRGRDEYRRGGGGVETQPVEYERRNRSEKARNNEVRDNRDADDGTEEQAELAERERNRD